MRCRIRGRDDPLLAKMGSLRAAVVAQTKTGKILVACTVLTVSVIAGSFYLFHGTRDFSLLTSAVGSFLFLVVLSFKSWIFYV
jgi:hypothetical protein